MRLPALPDRRHTVTELSLRWHAAPDYAGLGQRHVTRTGNDVDMCWGIRLMEMIVLIHTVSLGAGKKFGMAHMPPYTQGHYLHLPDSPQ